jgi:hypothetical protein
MRAVGFCDVCERICRAVKEKSFGCRRKESLAVLSEIESQSIQSDAAHHVQGWRMSSDDLDVCLLADPKLSAKLSQRDYDSWLKDGNPFVFAYFNWCARKLKVGSIASLSLVKPKELREFAGPDIEAVSMWTDATPKRIRIELVSPMILIERGLVGIDKDTMIDARNEAAKLRDKRALKDRYECLCLRALTNWTRLALHEIGHLALHRKSLATTGDSKPRFPIANAEQEQAAWFYGECVYALAIADMVARQRRELSGTRVGNIFRYL